MAKNVVKKENGVLVETERADACRNGEQTNCSLPAESGKISDDPNHDNWEHSSRPGKVRMKNHACPEKPKHSG